MWRIHWFKRLLIAAAAIVVFLSVFIGYMWFTIVLGVSHFDSPVYASFVLGIVAGVVSGCIVLWSRQAVEATKRRYRRLRYMVGWRLFWSGMSFCCGVAAIFALVLAFLLAFVLAPISRFVEGV